MVVLDTTVISELMRPEPEPKVLAWADGLEPEAVAITAMNEGKILHGLAGLPDGRRKQHLHQTWDGLGWPGMAWRPSISLGMAKCCGDVNSWPGRWRQRMR